MPRPGAAWLLRQLLAALVAFLQRRDGPYRSCLATAAVGTWAERDTMSLNSAGLSRGGFWMLCIECVLD